MKTQDLAIIALQTEIARLADPFAKLSSSILFGYTDFMDFCRYTSTNISVPHVVIEKIQEDFKDRHNYEIDHGRSYSNPDCPVVNDTWRLGYKNITVLRWFSKSVRDPENDYAERRGKHYWKFRPELVLEYLTYHINDLEKQLEVLENASD